VKRKFLNWNQAGVVKEHWEKNVNNQVLILN
jgi:hypothetical protein